MHAKGAGAHGYFETTHDVTDICCANLFAKVGNRVRATVRYSTVGGESGSADTARDPRGFAIKLKTEEGNLDWVYVVRSFEVYLGPMLTSPPSGSTTVSLLTFAWSIADGIRRSSPRLLPQGPRQVPPLSVLPVLTVTAVLTSAFAVIHTQKRDPQTHLKDATMFWDYLSQASRCGSGLGARR